MPLQNIGTVYRKELTDSLRDRRTLISTLLVPLLLFPILSVGFAALAVTLEKKAKEEIPKVMLLGGADSPGALELCAQAERSKSCRRLRTGKTRSSTGDSRRGSRFPMGLKPAWRNKIPRRSRFTNTKATEVFHLRGYGRERAQGLPGQRDRSPPGCQSCAFFHPHTVSHQAGQRRSARKSRRGRAWRHHRLHGHPALPDGRHVSGDGPDRGRKRTRHDGNDSFEPYLPPRPGLGKFFLVLTASLVTAALSVVSMGVSFWGMQQLKALDVSKNPDAAGMQLHIGFTAVLSVFLMALPLAVLFPPGVITISLFAKSYKEAQSYVSPLMVLVIIPAVRRCLPGVELTAKLALLPILNVSLLCKELVTGTYHWNFIALIFLSTCVYAAAALFLAVKMFQREDVLFRS